VNYFLIYFGSIPEYFKYTVNAIKSSDENSKIYMLSDDNLEQHGVINLNLEDIKDSVTNEVLSSNYYKSQTNPLWNTSMARIFAIKDMANYLEITNDILHFDTDVLIYDDFNKYKNKFDSLKGLHITQTNSDELIFGFSYINDITIYEKICNAIYKKLFGSENIADKSNLEVKNYSFNEMRMLREVEVENKGYIFPITSVPTKKEDIIFDPLDIGYFLGGQDKYENVPTIDSRNYLGEYIYNDKSNSRVEFVDKKPFLISHGIKNKIFNIHVHNKKLINYL
tara:strand:+ start:365 stop:1207 length:843 start_codon:yes stop_codon:yes gene_type:complete